MAAAKPGEKKRDRALYARLVESYQADRISIFIDFDRLNNPRSPVWNPWENIVPMLLILIASLTTMFFIHLLAGTALMVLGVMFYMYVLRPWISQRVYRRTIDAATENLHNWNLLWRRGGLIIALNYMAKTRCVAPEGDWRAFVTRYLPEMELEGVDSYNAFQNTQRSESGGGKPGPSSPLQDVNM
ncbi:MAG: hypothetical protein RLN70_01870 [Rhodospirillaceae bacterium]